MSSNTNTESDKADEKATPTKSSRATPETTSDSDSDDTLLYLCSKGLWHNDCL